MPLWDDATAPYTGSQPQQDSPSLWGWLTSLFGGQANRSSYTPTSPAQVTNPFNRWDPAQTPSPPSGGATPVYTGPGVNPTTYIGPGVDPSLYRGAAAWPSGVPASMRVAPPSMYTAANPQQQALWQQASTPAGYAALAAGAGGRPAAAVTPATSLAIPPPPPPKPMPPTWMPPAGGSTGWAGIQGLPGSPSGPGVMPPSPAAVMSPPPGTVMPPAGGSQGWAGRPGLAGSPSGPTVTGPRNLSDAELQKMGYDDIMNTVSRPELTYADRMALLHRLNAMSR